MTNPFEVIEAKLTNIELLLIERKYADLPKSVSDLDDDLITENEAKQILLVSKVTLKKWRDQGSIKFYRIGTRIRYRKSDLLKALEGKKKGRVK